MSYSPNLGARDTVAAAAPIIITAEMRRAGLAELTRARDNACKSDAMVCMVYAAMERARLDK